MIVAAHQPSFLPWLGYLDKLSKVDLFVVMDDLQYESQNFQNRNRIKLASGANWLTVPVERGSQQERIIDKRIDNGGSARQHWQRRMWRTIETSYARAPMFDHYAPDLEALFTRPWHWLLELDLHVLELARRWFGITVPIVRSSSLDLAGTRTERIVSLCERVGANAYLSGRGGSTGYLDTDLLARAGVSVAWQHFDHPVYAQRYPEHGFVSHLAFVDLVLNGGALS